MPSIYETRVMLPAIDRIKPSSTFFRETFFPAKNDEVLLSEIAELDYRKKKRRVAPFVAPRIGGATVNRDGFETSTIKTPIAAPQRIITADDIKNRSFGENVYTGKTPEQRAADLLRSDLVDLQEMHVNRQEIMIRDLLFKGAVIINGYIDSAMQNYKEYEIRFGEKKPEEPSAKWNTASSDILGDIRKWRSKIIAESSIMPTTLVMGTDVMNVIMNDEKIIKKLNLLNYTDLVVRPEVKSHYATYIGHSSSLGLDLYAYENMMVDESGKEVSVIPEGHLVMGSGDMGGFKFGLVTQLEKDGWKSYASKYVPLHYVNQSSNAEILRLTSRPVPVPVDFDAWAVAKVL